MSVAHRKGWCPGALRPMESGDGLIVRLRIMGGALRPDLARALAACAIDYGNGLIDLSGRANLQLRGVTQATLPALQARLDALGLLDIDPNVEAVRNILASPLAGIDPSAVRDIGSSIHALDERLRGDTWLHQLSPKFLFLIDDGGCFPLPSGSADIAFLARADQPAPFFEVRLAGKRAGSCVIGDLSATGARLAYVFLKLRRADETIRRMADLTARIGTDAITQAAGLTDMPNAAEDSRNVAPRLLGTHALGAHTALGLGIPFGRLDAQALHRLADAAGAVDGELRLSPWRAIFLVAKQIHPDLAARMHDAGFILDEEAPIRAVAACSGKPACLHGATASQMDAARLAPLARNLAASGIALHVSACAKGCAHPRPAPVTLIGRDGAYDLVLDAGAGDQPLLRSLDVPAVERLLQQLATTPPTERAALTRQFRVEAQI
ncbi:MAG: precorrin-3B synthase [Methylovirgula sp.]